MGEFIGLVVEGIATFFDGYIHRIFNDLHLDHPYLYRCLVLFFGLLIIVAFITSIRFLLISKIED